MSARRKKGRAPDQVWADSWCTIFDTVVDQLGGAKIRDAAPDRRDELRRSARGLIRAVERMIAERPKEPTGSNVIPFPR